MEPNNIEVCYNKDKEKNRKKDSLCFCMWLIVGIVSIVLSFFIGILVAALTTILSILGIGGIVTLIIILAVLLLIAIINVICCKRNDRKKYGC